MKISIKKSDNSLIVRVTRSFLTLFLPMTFGMSACQNKTCESKAVVLPALAIEYFDSIIHTKANTVDWSLSYDQVFCNTDLIYLVPHDNFEGVSKFHVMIKNRKVSLLTGLERHIHSDESIQENRHSRDQERYLIEIVNGTSVSTKTKYDYWGMHYSRVLDWVVSTNLFWKNDLQLGCVLKYDGNIPGIFDSK